MAFLFRTLWGVMDVLTVFLKKYAYLFVYLAVQGLSCSMQDLSVAGRLAAACKLLVVACGI